MRLVTHVVTAHALMLLLGAVWRILPFEVIAPLPVLIYATFLGVSGRDRLPAATGVAVLIGYLADLLAGAPPGFMATVAGVACVGTRVVSRRLLLRGRLFVAGFTLATSLAASVLIVGVRFFYDVAVGGLWQELVVAIGSALLTAALAPAVFRLCRLVEAAFARTARERDALREGYLS